jgi:hypothetical protein
MLIIFLPMKAIDFHVHLPTPEWLDVSMKGYVEAAESYFRSKVAKRSLDELARDYEELDMVAVLLAWSHKRAATTQRRSWDSAAWTHSKAAAPSLSSMA